MLLPGSAHAQTPSLSAGVVLPPGDPAFTANGLSNDVSVIDVARGTVVATIAAGDGPWGVAYGR